MFQIANWAWFTWKTKKISKIPFSFDLSCISLWSFLFIFMLIQHFPVTFAEFSVHFVQMVRMYLFQCIIDCFVQILLNILFPISKIIWAVSIGDDCWTLLIFVLKLIFIVVIWSFNYVFPWEKKILDCVHNWWQKIWSKKR